MRMENAIPIKYEQRSGFRPAVVDLNKKRKVYDNIHRFISFPQRVWDFIDTPHFQRLRKIKQLGCLEYVFPGATHTRFQHSLGTAHLAKTFLSILIENNPTLYEKTDKKSAILTITLAGLLHDLGHGPYSHTFDSFIVTKINKKGEQKSIKWTHQLASEQLFLDLVKQEGLKDHLTKEEIERVRVLIKGEPVGERKWEFQIISNKANGIDVDKLDYFRRDAFHLGAQNIFVDHDLLMNEARIIGDDICYPSKYAQMVYNIFHCRYKLYKDYYFNLVSLGIQLMICDILEIIKEKFNFQQICQNIFQNPKEYLKLTDNIIEKVEDIHDYIQQHPECQDAKKYKDKFQAAVDILGRIKTRKIYKFVREFHYFLQEKTDKKIIKIMNEQLELEKITDEVSKMARINKNDICLSISDINFGMKDINPLTKVRFFNKKLNEKMPTKIKEDQSQSLSMLYTQFFQERSIKIFLKTEDPHALLHVQKAFYDYCKSINNKCKEILHQSGLNVVFEGRGTTPMIHYEEEPKAMNDSEESYPLEGQKLRDC